MLSSQLPIHFFAFAVIVSGHCFTSATVVNGQVGDRIPGSNSTPQSASLSAVGEAGEYSGQAIDKHASQECWTGSAVSSSHQSNVRVEMTRHSDGAITGRWGSAGSMVTIDRGEQVTTEVIRWESSNGQYRWVVTGKFNGDSLVLEYTCASRQNGRIEGGIGTAVLSRSSVASEDSPRKHPHPGLNGPEHGAKMLQGLQQIEQKKLNSAKQ